MESKKSEIEMSEKLIALSDAAKILGCDPRVLLGFIDDDYFIDMIENDAELEKQSDELLCLIEDDYLDAQDPDSCEKVTRVMEMVPEFKQAIQNMIEQDRVFGAIMGNRILCETVCNAILGAEKDDKDLKN